jgi:hypothetical protein
MAIEVYERYEQVSVAIMYLNAHQQLIKDLVSHIIRLDGGCMHGMH